MIFKVVFDGQLKAALTVDDDGTSVEAALRGCYAHRRVH